MSAQPIPLPTRPSRKVPVMVRVTPVERQRIEALAQEHEVSMSDLVRLAVDRFLGDVARHGIAGTGATLRSA